MTDHAHNFKDLLNKRFGRWLVIGQSTRESLDGRGKKTVGTNRARAARWICRCDCGMIREVPGEKMRQGKSKSCGCINTQDLAGRKFGTWKALRLVRDLKGVLVWLCRCEATGIYAMFDRAALFATIPPPCFNDMPRAKLSSRKGRCGSWKKIGYGNTRRHVKKRKKLSRKAARKRGKTYKMETKEWVVAVGCAGLELFECTRSHWQILLPKGMMTPANPLPCPSDWSRHSKAVDYRGQVFGTWRAVEHVKTTKANRVAVWKCECTRCGRIRNIPSVSLNSASDCNCKKDFEDKSANQKSVAQATAKA